MNWKDMSKSIELLIGCNRANRHEGGKLSVGLIIIDAVIPRR